MTNKQLISSHVRHKDQYFYVSTVDWDSTTPVGFGYSETMAWSADPDTLVPVSLAGQREGSKGSIEQHLQVCRELFATGQLTEGK